MVCQSRNLFYVSFLVSRCITYIYTMISHILGLLLQEEKRQVEAEATYSTVPGLFDTSLCLGSECGADRHGEAAVFYRHMLTASMKLSIGRNGDIFL